MIKSRYFPDKTFQSKEELFKQLKDNAELIIDEKKSLIQKSCDKGISVNCKPLDVSKLSEEIKGFKADDNYWYIVTNTTRILDSHEDLHLDGLWKKSIDEQKGKNYLTADHELKLADVIVRKEYVEMFTASIPYTLLGYSYSGNTQALIYKVPKDKVINKTAKDWLESGDSIEASVRMQYVTILLAMDSNAPEDAIEKKNYDDLIDTIANKADFDYIPYFFGIKEAKNVKESSLVVFGSNHVTGVVSSNQKEIKEEPTEVTPIEINTEPAQATQNKRRKLLI